MAYNPNSQNARLWAALCDMETTALIAAELDKVLSDIDNASSSIEIVAAVTVAQINSGKGKLTMEGLKQ